MVSIDIGTTIDRLGNTSFTTMATTLNFFVQTHYDETDNEFGVIAWFDKCFKINTCTKSQFRFVKYGVFFESQQGSLTVLKATEMMTIRNPCFK